MILHKHNPDGSIVEKDVLDQHVENILKQYPNWTKPGQKPKKGAFEITVSEEAPIQPKQEEEPELPKEDEEGNLNSPAIVPADEIQSEKPKKIGKKGKGK